MNTTVPPKPGPKDQQSTVSRFSLVKVAALTASITFVGLAAVCVLLASSSRKITELAPFEVRSKDERSKSASAPTSIGGYATHDKLPSQIGSRSDTIASSGPAESLSAETPRFGALRLFFFGTRTRKVVFSAVATVLVLLVVFVVVYFGVLSPRNGGGDGIAGDGAGGSSNGQPNGTPQLTVRQQAELQVSIMKATEPVKFYGLAFGVPGAIFAIFSGAIVWACYKARITFPSSDSILKDLLTGRSLFAAALCLFAIIALIAIPLGLFLGDGQAYWLIVYTLVESAPSFPMVLAFVLLALGVIALLFLIFLAWCIKKKANGIGAGLFRQFMFWTNHLNGNNQEKGKRSLLIKLAIIFMSTAGCCIGLAYAIAHPGDARMLCAVILPSVGVFILSIMALCFNQVFKSKCIGLVEFCGGPVFQTI